MGEIKRQSINNTLLSYVGAGLGFLILYIQPFLMQANDIGLLRLMFSFSWMAAVIMPLGIGSITVRFFPKIRNDENTHHGFFGLIFLIASAGALVVACVLYMKKSFFAHYYERSPDFPVYFAETLLFAYILSLINVYSIYSSSLFKTTFTVFLTDVFTRIGQLVVILLYHYRLIDQNVLVLSYIGVFLLQLILLIIYLFKSKAVSLKINYSFYKNLDLKEVGFFGILMTATAFASLGIKFIDQLLIGHYLSAEMVAVYATCVMMCVVMEIPFNSLERIANPKISHAWHISDKDEVNKIYELSSRYMFFAGGVIFCLLWSAIDLVFYFLPSFYHQGKLAFYIVSCSSLLNLLTGVNSSVILYSHKYFAASFFLFILVFVSYFANSLLIPVYGISGAAMATVIAIGSFNLLKYFYILARFGMQPFSRHTLYIALCITIVVGVIYIIPDQVHSLLKAVIGGIVTVAVFSFENIKFNSVEEVNKVFKRLGLLKNKQN
jgi:O-antigen/teichoic acid export membrane protein